MPETIETGTKETPGDADQGNTGNNDAAGGQQTVTQDAAGSQEKEAEGLKAAAQAERTKRQEAETKNAQLQQQMQIMSANQGQQQAATQPQTSMFMQAAKQLGYDPDYLSPEETGHVMDTLLQYMAQGQQDVVFNASHPDFDEVVGKVVNGTFQESPHLQKVFETNPGLRQAFHSTGLTPSTKLIAYQMVKNDPTYQTTVKEAGMTDEQKKAAEADAKIKAANTVGSISNVQGSGNLDRGANLAGMTDEEFQKEKEKVMDRAT